MTFSTYQLERLLDKLRRWRNFFHWPVAHPEEKDRVSLSGRSDRVMQSGNGAMAKDLAKKPGNKSSVPGGGAQALSRVVDDRKLDPLVEKERERRAATFLPKKFVPDDPNRGRGKIKKTSRLEEQSKKIAEGD